MMNDSSNHHDSDGDDHATAAAVLLRPATTNRIQQQQQQQQQLNHHHHHHPLTTSNSISSNNNNNNTNSNHFSSSRSQLLAPVSSQKRTLHQQHSGTGGSTTNTLPLPFHPTQQQQPPPFLFRLRSFVSNLLSGVEKHHHHHHHHQYPPPTTSAPRSNSPSSASYVLDGGGGSSHHRHFNNHHVSTSSTTTTNTTIPSIPAHTYKNENNGHLDPNVLKGLTMAGVASTIIHTMMGLQTEHHILSNIAASKLTLDPNRNLVSDLIVNNITAASAAAITMTDSSNMDSQIMIRTTSSQKLQYDLLIRLIGTAIVFYYSIRPLPFQQQQQQQQQHYRSSKVRRRLDMIGTMGLLFVIVFLVVQQIPTLLPFYEWMRVLLIVVIASPVINDVSMYDTARIQFIMSGQVINFITTLLVRYICEAVTTATTKSLPEYAFTSTPILVTNLFVSLSAMLFVTAQNLISNTNTTALSVRDVLAVLLRRQPPPPRFKEHTEQDDDNEQQQQQHPRLHSTMQQPHAAAPLTMEWTRIVSDMVYSNNMQRWTIMQLLLEIQMSILYLLFLYTILYEIDRNVNDTRVLWTLFRLRKVDTILVHVPMFLFGYTGVYYTLFMTIFGISFYAYCITDQAVNALSTVHILTIVFYISCMAVHSAGFNVAMADLTMSIRYNLYTKTSHTNAATTTTTTTTTIDDHHRRSDHELNIAGIVIAYNSFVCKPITYFISGVVASILRHARSTNKVSSTAFYLLVYTTMCTSSVQIYVWRRYGLVKHRTTLMRDEFSQVIPK